MIISSNLILELDNLSSKKHDETINLSVQRLNKSVMFFIIGLTIGGDAIMMVRKWGNDPLLLSLIMEFN